jgi:peptide/nickel transport system substrate-binding protein
MKIAKGIAAGIALLLVVSACGAATDSDTGSKSSQSDSTATSQSEAALSPSTDQSTAVAPGDGDAAGDDAVDADAQASFPLSEDLAKGGSMTLGLGGLAPVLDPMMYGTPPTNFVQELLFTSILRMRPNADGVQSLIPGVAVKWEQVDPTIWNFEIPEGKAFPNGEALDADTLAFSINYMRDPDNGKANANQIATVKDAYSDGPGKLVVETSAPDPLLPNRMVAVYALPPKAVAEKGAAFFNDPVGTGPFTVSKFVPEQSLDLIANEASLFGPPPLDELHLVVLADASARIAALQAGDVDGINRLTTEQVTTMRDSGFTVAYQLENGTYIVTAIQSDGPLADPNVRRAVSLAIDRKGLNEGILGNLGLPASQFIRPGTLGYCEALDDLTYDPDEAKRLLSDAGYPDGFDTVLQASNGYLVNDTDLAQAIQNQLDAVGIHADLQIQEWGSYLDAYFDPGLRKGLYAWRNGNQYFLDAESPFSNLQGSDAAHKTVWVNDKYNSLLQDVRKESNMEKRQSDFCSMAEILRNDNPLIPVLHLPDVWALSKDVANFPINGSGAPLFGEIGFASK